MCSFCGDPECQSGFAPIPAVSDTGEPEQLTEKEQVVVDREKATEEREKQRNIKSVTFAQEVIQEARAAFKNEKYEVIQLIGRAAQLAYLTAHREIYNEFQNKYGEKKV